MKPAQTTAAMRKRQLIIAVGMLVAAACLIGRLAWLQWVPALMPGSSADHWREASVHQREKAIRLASGRGHFTDRHGRAITGEMITGLAAFPVKYGTWGEPDEVKRLAALLGVTQEALLDWLSGLREPEFWRLDGDKEPMALTNEQLAELQHIRLDGVRALPYERRYRSAFAAKHAIGYISQHPELIAQSFAEQLAAGRMQLTDRIGGAGLERSLDPLLRGLGDAAASHYVDGRRTALHGLDLRIVGPDNPYYPLQIRTTLDLQLQNLLEEAVDRAGLREGAVVVLDVHTADIVAMISRPLFDPYRLEEPGTDWANHALIAQPPGSLFKLVTAASALEHAVTEADESFHCDGEYGRYGLSCWKEGGHGTLSLQEALAQSCNIAFATLAERLDGTALSQTADRLGISRRVGWAAEQPLPPLSQPLRLLQEEQAGAVFAQPPRQRDGGQLAQTGIGQRDVRVTPLQAANLIVTLLRGGEVLAPRLVSEISYANGQRLMSLPVQPAPSAYGRIAPATAAVLLRGMESVVNEGTGRTIRDGAWQVAGKSGTAQALVDGRPCNHHWFAGYGPVQAPRYAVAVLAEDRPPGESNQATALFRTVMDRLAAIEPGR
ncbi:peptidoglycan D,D-transpeptidase FtsI family protein [Paenibacillus sp. 1P07SE]|uniref:peptidoglycan D,D-transpeptidase FtsI family protein n=1 Tax=Paenibacillus sp. 1P07SE TaxID=3132209 RepID=UPI0039A54247